MLKGEPPIFGRVAIAGYGLIGGSIGLAIKRRWPSTIVCAIDRASVVEVAICGHGADVGGDDLSLASDADLVVLAAPVLANIARLQDLPNHIAPGALATDVGSTKRRIVAAAEGLPAVSFIGGHPMAGAARGGVARARADLFDGRPWILTPRAAHPEAMARLDQFVTGLGGVPHVMSPELHDRFVGAVSHLPQLTASALMHVVGKLAGDAGLELAGSGLRDTTRLAASPPDIWRDIAATNDDVLREALDALIETLTELRDGLSEGDAINAVFTSACRWREALDRARGE